MISTPYTQEFVDVFYPLIVNESLTSNLVNDTATDPASQFLSKYLELQAKLSMEYLISFR